MGKAFAGVLLITGCSLLLAALGPAYGEALSADQAKSKAAEFAKALSLPWGDTIEVALRENISTSRRAEWQAKFGRFSYVGVSLNGVVTSAADFSQAETHSAAKAPPELKEAEAAARASEIVTLAGIPQVASLSSPRITLEHGTPGASEFRVLYDREYKGIPFEQCGVDICLAGDTGAMLWLSTGLDVPNPDSTEVKFGEQEAKDSAIKDLAVVAPSRQVTDISSTLKIVLPNSYWASQEVGEQEDATKSRVAWVVSLTTADGIFVFWIDAQDGRVLGGARSGGRIDLVPSPSNKQVPERIDHQTVSRLVGAGLLLASFLLALAGISIHRRRGRTTA